MEKLRIGPVEIAMITVLAIAIGVAMNTGKSQMVVGAVLAIALLVLAFVSTTLSLYLLVCSMLLSPEFVVGGLGGATATAGRGVTLRMDDFLLFVIGLAWLVKAAVKKDEAPVKRTPLNGPIMFYSAAALFATLMGVLAGRVKPLTGFFFNLKYFEYFFLYFMVISAVNTQKQARGLMTASFITCFLVALYALAQIPTGQRASAPFEGAEGEPNTLGGYLVFMMCIAAGLLLTRDAVPKKWPLIVMLVTSFLGLLATLSRGSFLALGIVTLILIIYISYRKPLLFTIVLLVIVTFPVWAPATVKQRILFTFTQKAEVGQTKIGGVKVDTSTSERISQWKKSLTYFEKSPLWGTGVTGGILMDAMYPRVVMETGLLGSVAFLVLCWVTFRMAWTCYMQSLDPMSQGLAFGFLLGFLAMLIHAIGSNTFIIVRIMEPFWLYAALLMRSTMLSEAGAPREQDAVGDLRMAPVAAFERPASPAFRRPG